MEETVSCKLGRVEGNLYFILLCGSMKSFVSYKKKIGLLTVPPLVVTIESQKKNNKKIDIYSPVCQ